MAYKINNTFGTQIVSLSDGTLDTTTTDLALFGKGYAGFGEKLNEKPRIELSTIHGAKGGESQNVVLLTDLTQNTMKGYERDPDDENRLFYVGATRTKENLHIIEPRKYEKGYLL